MIVNDKKNTYKLYYQFNAIQNRVNDPLLLEGRKRAISLEMNGF